MSLLRARECNIAMFRDIYATVKIVFDMLDSAVVPYSNNNSTQNGTNVNEAKMIDLTYGPYKDILQSLLILTQHESGTAINATQLHRDCGKVLSLISNTIQIATLCDIVQDDSDPMTTRNSNNNIEGTMIDQSLEEGLQSNEDSNADSALYTKVNKKTFFALLVDAKCFSLSNFVLLTKLSCYHHPRIILTQKHGNCYLRTSII